jgi:hypothetical protein
MNQNIYTGIITVVSNIITLEICVEHSDVHQGTLNSCIGTVFYPDSLYWWRATRHNFATYVHRLKIVIKNLLSIQPLNQISSVIMNEIIYIRSYICSVTYCFLLLMHRLSCFDADILIYFSNIVSILHGRCYTVYWLLIVTLTHLWCLVNA